MVSITDHIRAGIWLFSGGLSKRDGPSEYLEFYHPISYAYTAFSKSAAMPTMPSAFRLAL